MTYSDRTQSREALTAAAFLCRARHGRKSQEPTCKACLGVIRIACEHSALLRKVGIAERSLSEVAARQKGGA